jgi:hypothetical protein
LKFGGEKGFVAQKKQTVLGKRNLCFDRSKLADFQKSGAKFDLLFGGVI